MLVILNPNTSASFNMAAEEYILKTFQEDAFMLWQADKTVLIGKNQNTRKEINVQYVEDHKIKVIRRLSGGGAVYNDLGNTNFAFISTDSGDGFSNFRKFTAPILELLNSLGVPAEFSGRNDLLVNGRKFSGNAQFKHKNRLLHHGTLLFSSNMELLGKALSPDMLKFKSKGVTSVKSRVTNIAEHLSEKMTVETFMDKTNQHILDKFPGSKTYTFRDEDIEAIKKIETNRFANWEWNYGASPKYNFMNQEKFPGGLVEINLEVKNSLIKSAKIYGDFFSQADISEVEKALVGVKHETESVKQALSAIDLDKYLSGIGLDEMLQLFN
ncbi:lipoate--protein ligase [Fusibacter sp. JL216-2]|uniref:lipoate--protein ligase n=1 Tax=Fusibacter sp. JL216-2 TaxID=3071453 RepID=UPI003D333802